jgi:hypothetical protein
MKWNLVVVVLHGMRYHHENRLSQIASLTSSGPRYGHGAVLLIGSVLTVLIYQRMIDHPSLPEEVRDGDHRPVFLCHREGELRNKGDASCP